MEFKSIVISYRRHQGFTLTESIISLFILCGCIFLFCLGMPLIKNAQLLSRPSEIQTADQAMIQLEHYFQRSAFRLIKDSTVLAVKRQDKLSSNNWYVRHLSVIKEYNTPLAGQVSNSLRLQDLNERGYMPLLENVKKVTLWRVAPYIDVQLSLQNGQTYYHRFYCPTVWKED